MMITPEQAAHVAHLARLQLSEAEQEQFTAQLGTILDYMAQLNEVSTDGVEPTSHVLDLVNVFREDRAEQKVTVEAVLRNAPESAHQYVVVPRIVE